MAVNNPDSLFQQPHLSVSVDYDSPGDNPHCGYRNRLNNGLFIFQQDDEFLSFVKTKIKLTDKSVGTSQEVMTEFYGDKWNRLPYTAGAFPHSCRCSAEPWSDPKKWLIVHFTWSCHKPGDIWWDSKLNLEKAIENIPPDVCQFHECKCARPIYERWLGTASRVSELDSQKTAPIPLESMRGNCSSPSREAFVTVISRPEWIPGVETLAHSLKLTQTTRPLIGIIPSGGPSAGLNHKERQILIDVGVLLCDVKHISNPDKHGQHAARRDCFNKLAPWELDLETAVFLDADVAVLQNIDHMFSMLPKKSGHVIAGVQEGKGSYFNSGVFVFHPSKSVFNDMLSKINTLHTYDAGDQGFFDSYFFGGKNREERGLKVLDATYNFRRSMRMLTHENVLEWFPDKTYRELDACFETAHKSDPSCNVMFEKEIKKRLDSIKIIHFVSDQKPWNFPATDYVEKSPNYGMDFFFRLPVLDAEWTRLNENLKHSKKRE